VMFDLGYLPPNASGQIGVIQDCRIQSLHLTTVARRKLDVSLSF
jgi:hypothetical protein